MVRRMMGEAMWNTLFDRMLRRAFRSGDLRVRTPDGTWRTYGDGTGCPIAVTIHDPAFRRRALLDPELALGEAYTDGTLTIANDDLRGFLALAVRNADRADSPVRRPGQTLARLARHWRQFAPASRARRNVAHHYDLSSDLYGLFLDRDRQYSCAYFAAPDLSLDAAQAAKKAHVARKLLIAPGMRVLDIGCGWGGMALTLARDHGARVVGVTLSEEQHAFARARVARAGLDGRIDIRLQDYRAVPERFDRIVSVGMFEHVGVPHYADYFRTVRDRLAPDGVALIHTIGRIAPPGATSPWIDRYIFPGGYVPALSEMTAAIERERLYLCDVEVWRMHYAKTLRHWSDRFEANAARAAALYDARFVRMWRYYLAICETTFRHGRQAVFQVQLAHRQDAVPITRDYLHAGDPAAIRHAAE